MPVNPSKFLLIRQHNQFGDMLATIPLFRAIKEKYPQSEITLIASPENYFAVEKNKYIDKVFNFDKKKMWGSAGYIKTFWRLLRKEYDVAIVPVTVSISSTSCIMARLSKSSFTIGPFSLNGKENKLGFLFDCAVEMDWRKYPGISVSRFSMEILKPLNISSSNYQSHITFDDTDLKKGEAFLAENKLKKSRFLIGFHVGAGKPPNRWSLDKYTALIERLKSEFGIDFLFTGSSGDKEEIGFMEKRFGDEAGYFLNRPIPQLAALISMCDLFITNDTGVMHVAGAVDVPQISIFGPTNPDNWAPAGNNKHVIRKGESIDLVSVDEVFNLAVEILSEKRERK